MGKEFLNVYDHYNKRVEQFRTDEYDILPLMIMGLTVDLNEEIFLLYTSDGRNCLLNKPGNPNRGKKFAVVINTYIFGSAL